MADLLSRRRNTNGGQDTLPDIPIDTTTTDAPNPHHPQKYDNPSRSDGQVQSKQELLSPGQPVNNDSTEGDPIIVASREEPAEEDRRPSSDVDITTNPETGKPVGIPTADDHDNDSSSSQEDGEGIHSVGDSDIVPASVNDMELEVEENPLPQATEDRFNFNDEIDVMMLLSDEEGPVHDVDSDADTDDREAIEVESLTRTSIRSLRRRVNRILSRDRLLAILCFDGKVSSRNCSTIRCVPRSSHARKAPPCQDPDQ